MAQLTLEDPARALTVRLGAWLQPRYEFSSGSERLSSFILRRVRLDAAGSAFTDRLGFRIQYDMSRSGQLRDAYLDYRLTETAWLRFGQFPIPFQFRVTPRRQEFAESGAGARAFGQPGIRDIGLLLFGGNEAGSSSYELGVFDGSGANTRLSNSVGNLWSLRLGLAPRGRIPGDEVDFAKDGDNLALGVALLGATDSELRDWSLGRSPTGNAEGDFITVTSDLVLQRAGWTVAAAAFGRGVAPSDPAVGRYHGLGGELSASYVLIRERVALGVRHSRVRWDQDAPETEERAWQAALSFFRLRHSWKTRIYLEDLRRDTPGARSEWLIGTEMQLLI